MKEFIRFSFVLGLICLVTGSSLAVVNLFTKPRIEQQKLKQEQDALKSVLPKADEFSKVNDRIFYYIAYQDKQIIGFVLKSSNKGYSSVIEILTGVDTNLNIVNVKILTQSETPGLGSRIESKDFLMQFQNKNLVQLNNVDAITGATVSSKAVIDSIEKSLGDFKGYLKEIKNAE